MTATNVGTRATAFRFYLIHRLEETLDVIKNKKSLDCPLFAYKFEDSAEGTLFEKFLTFRHPRIRRCIQEIEDSHTNDPLHNLCRDFRSFYYVGDFQFITELLQLIFVFQRYLMCQKNNKLNKPLFGQCDLVERWYKKISNQSIRELVDVVDGIVTVKLQGACAGCPMSQMTLKMGIERYLKKEIPEVTEVVSV